MGAVDGWYRRHRVTVVDDDSGQAVEAALVYIPALDLGGSSDAQGRFEVVDVPVGEHEVRAELIGYSRTSATVSVQAGKTAAVELRLKPAAILLEETAVTGTAFVESPINAPYAVAVASRKALEEQGSPQPVDFFKNLGASHGVIGEANSTIDPFLTWDLNFLWNLSGKIGLTFSALNLTGAEPPLVNREHAHDGLTHSSKGRRFKLAVSFQLPSETGKLF